MKDIDVLGENGLLFAVLERAILDSIGNRAKWDREQGAAEPAPCSCAPRKIRKRWIGYPNYKEEAREWIKCDEEHDWGFVWVCELLSLSHTRVRQTVVNYWDTGKSTKDIRKPCKSYRTIIEELSFLGGWKDRDEPFKVIM